MFKIVDNTIEITRGDSGVLALTLTSSDGSSRWNDLDYMRCPGAGKIIASIYQPDSDAWIDIDMEDVTIGTESDAWIEII